MTDVAAQIGNVALELEQLAVELLRQPLELGVVGVVGVAPTPPSLEG